MPKDMLWENEEHEDLEPWETEESRRESEAWRGAARRRARAHRGHAPEVAGSVQLPHDVFQQLATAALSQLQYQLTLNQMRRELDLLRRDVDRLRAALPILSIRNEEAFSVELEQLERTMAETQLGLPDGYDLGAIIDEWT